MQKKTVIVASAAVALLAGAVIWAGRGGSARVSTDTYAVEVAEGKEGKITAAAAPVTLTASDGSGLRLVSMSARASVHDPLAFTELRLVFENPEDRVREGTFRITLPQGASLSRFAMKVGSTWQEGEMVEKQAARRAYEDFLHRRQDPALLEQGGGNEFTARVFPIPAKGKKEIILSYSAELKESDPYTLALKGLPTLDELDISVRAEGTSDAVFGFKRGRFTPGADFIVDRKRIPRASALRAGDMMVARVVPMADQKKEPLGRTIVLFDTSASRALGLADSARALADLVAKLDADVTVILFDQTTDTVFSGKGATFGDQGVSAITRRGALGASNLEAAIASATELAKAKGAERLVVMSDGVPTAGETDPARLAGKLEALRAAGVKRVDAVAVGGIRDDGVLRKLTRGAMPSDGVVLGAELGAEEIARRLALGTTSKVPIKVEGASFWYPKTVDGLQPGDEVLVYAELTSQSPKVVVGDRPPQALSPRAAPRPLVERAFAQAKIASLYESGADANKAEIVRLSTSHRVLSPFTAMLVLETDADYRRFGIDRNANVDILTVEDGRVALKRSSRAGEADDDEQGGTGTRAKGEEGRMGRAQNGAAATATAAAPQTAPRDESAVAGPRGGVDVPTEQRPAPPAPGQARAEALREAAEFGMIGSLDPASPDPWGHGGAPAASAAAT
ncbi:MAG: hypothetical protein JNL38_02225, partial [Myxococcales bacterium]|nr:hypothetical protein [Myxococcales bacterium]